MFLIKKNIWTLFFSLIIFATLLFSILSYVKWNETNEEFRMQNENFTKLITQSTQNYFEQLDIILELLGKQLIEDDNYKDTVKSKELFNKILKLNPSIIAYALINPQGKYLLTHLDEPADNIPGVLTKEASRDTFLEALKTDNMTIGRTYSLTRSKILAIPIRKTFFDSNKKPIAVMSIAIPVNNTNLFNEDILQSYSDIIHLFRDKDKYRQLYLYKTKEDKIKDIYTKPISQYKYDLISQRITNKYNTTIEEFKKNQNVVSFEFEDKDNQKRYFISTKYMKKYGLWSSSYINYDEIVNKFIKNFLIYLSVYLTGLVITWWLFWMINKSEKDKRILLEYKALHDTLTDLPNRYYLQKNIDKWTNKTNFSLIYFDLDNFKYINDTFGHKFGDEVLKALSNRLRKTINTNDLLIRQGGDEFLIFTNEVSNIEEFCNKLLETFRKPLSVLGSNIIVNGSFGVSNFPKDSQDIDELIVCSDIACYEAKSKRNSYKVFKEEIKNKHIEIMQIEKELKQALEKKELYLVYQPQVNYDNTLYGIETLLRWNNEKLGNVSPEKFIGIAETIGLMPKIGDFIIDTALNQIKTLQDKNKKSFQLSINVSVTQFIEVGFLENLMNKIDKYKIDPSLITLEITESVLIDNLEYMQSLFLQLREKGFTISLDDFGTGYSSLSMLRSVPINELKIDKAFVDDIIDDKTARLLIKTIIEIGNILNYNIVLAEGVESKDQVELLNEFGCRTYQGYFYSKPLEIHRLEQFIQKY